MVTLCMGFIKKHHYKCKELSANPSGGVDDEDIYERINHTKKHSLLQEKISAIAKLALSCSKEVKIESEDDIDPTYDTISKIASVNKKSREKISSKKLQDNVWTDPPTQATPAIYATVNKESLTVVISKDHCDKNATSAEKECLSSVCLEPPPVPEKLWQNSEELMMFLHAETSTEKPRKKVRKRKKRCAPVDEQPQYEASLSAEGLQTAETELVVQEVTSGICDTDIIDPPDQLQSMSDVTDYLQITPDIDNADHLQKNCDSGFAETKSEETIREKTVNMKKKKSKKVQRMADDELVGVSQTDIFSTQKMSSFSKTTEETEENFSTAEIDFLDKICEKILFGTDQTNLPFEKCIASQPTCRTPQLKEYQPLNLPELPSSYVSTSNTDPALMSSIPICYVTQV